MLNRDGAGTDWALEEYRLLAALVASRQADRVGVRRLAVALVAVLAGLRYLLPRLGAGEGPPGPELLAFGVFVVVGAWLLELYHYVSQDRAECRMRAIDVALAGGSRIGHDLRARPRRDATPSSPRLGHVLGGEGPGLARGLRRGLGNVGIGGFHLVLLAAFCAFYALADPVPVTGSVAPSQLEQRLEGIEAAVRRIPDQLDRIADEMDALPEEIAGSIDPEPPAVVVDVAPPDLAPLLGSLAELRSRLEALEGAIRELAPPAAPPAPPAPPAACEGRAWGIGSSSVSCGPAKP